MTNTALHHIYAPAANSHLFTKIAWNARECRHPFTTFSRLDLIANRYLDTVERQEHVAPKHISGIYQILTSTSTNYSNIGGILDGHLVTKSTYSPT